MTNSTIKGKTKQNNEFNINNSNWQIAHSTKNSSKRQRGSKDIHFQNNNKFTPLLAENTDDNTKCKSTIIAQANSKNSHQKPPLSNNEKSISHFERKRRRNICLTENDIKSFTPVTIPGNSNYATISKTGHKILVVGDSHVKQIRRINFNQELRNDKACFPLFSGTTSSQVDHYIIPLLADNKPDTCCYHPRRNHQHYIQCQL